MGRAILLTVRGFTWGTERTNRGGSDDGAGGGAGAREGACAGVDGTDAEGVVEREGAPRPGAGAGLGAGTGAGEGADEAGGWL